MPSIACLISPPLGPFPCRIWKLESENYLDLVERGRNILARLGAQPFVKRVVYAHFFLRTLVSAFFSGGFTLSTSAITSLNGRGMCGIGFEFVVLLLSDSLVIF